MLSERKVAIISPSVQNWAFSGVDVLRYALSPRFWGTLFRLRWYSRRSGSCAGNDLATQLPQGQHSSTGPQFDSMERCE